MTDDTTQVPGDQTASASSSATSGQVAMVEKTRLDNAMAKIQELTLANRALADENTALKTSKGQLEAKVTTAASEMDAKTAEFTKQLGEFTSKEKDYSDKQKSYEDLQRKLRAIKELNVPQLVSIVDVLPVAETDALQIEAIKSIADFARSEAATREKQLTAGVTKTVVASAGLGELPTTDEGWTKLIENAPLGSEKRQEAMDAWFAYSSKK